MAARAGALGQQFGHRTGGLGGGRLGNTLAMRGVVGSQIGLVLIGQRTGDAAHRRVLAITLLVGVQGGHDVAGGLARDHRDLVDLGEAGAIAGDAVAADAHRRLGLAGSRITLDLLGLGGRDTADQGQRREGHGPKDSVRREQILHGLYLMPVIDTNPQL
jgi:hypothetical protein